MTFSKYAALTLALLTSTHALQTQADSRIQQAWLLQGFEQPESVVADAHSNFLYVSNINGHPTALNGKGYISRITPEGKMDTQHWASGLNAPKGMAIWQNTLYVADMQTLHAINLSNGQIEKRYEAPNAGMLNDVTVADDGTVYVSDFFKGTLYRLKDEQFEPWFSDADIPHPNGLLWDNGQLLIGSWGTGMQEDFSTQTLGSLYALNPNTHALTQVEHAQTLGNLDGIVRLGESLIMSDWINGGLYQVSAQHKRQLLKLPQGLADIGVTQNLILAPMMMDGQVQAWRVQ